VDTMYVYLGAEERNQMEAKGNLDFLKWCERKTQTRKVNSVQEEH
jgi:hypothetical protein